MEGETQQTASDTELERATQTTRRVSQPSERGSPQQHVESQTPTRQPSDAENCAADNNAFCSAVTVHPRYRHHHTSSQGSYSNVNGSAWSASHSRMSSHEHFSWDFLAWKEATADLHLSSADPAREYLRFSRVSNDGRFDSQDMTEQRPRRHARSFAVWDKNEVDASGKDLSKGTLDSTGTREFTSPIGKRGYSGTESVCETAPLGHQHSFSLFSHKDATQSNRENLDDKAVHVEAEGTESAAKFPVMTHVIVSFKSLYGVYYVPQSERGKFNVGDLVSVESHTGENTGRVVYDLTSIMRDSSLMPAHFAALRQEQLYPEDASLPLESVDPVTNEETLLRLPRIIRRGMNKGKKRLYYARRRDTEAFSVCQRLIRDRGFALSVSGVEYQVDFKRLTVYCSGSSSSVNPNELLTFIQQLAANLRGSMVVVLFSSETPESLEVTRGITKGAFNHLYREAVANTQETQTTQQARTRTPPPAHPPARVPCSFLEGSVPPMGASSVMPMFNLQPHVQTVPARQPLVMGAVGLNTAVYGMPGMTPLGWGWPTPPPYITHPHIAPGLGGRM